MHAYFQRFILSIVIASMAMATGCGEDTSSPANATWKYWTDLHQISQRGKPLEKRMDSVSTPQEVIAVMHDASELIQQMARDISNLPVSNVDPDVIEYTSQSLVVLNDSASVFSQFARLLEENQALQQHAGSFDAGLESFMRGFFGDPLGKYNELNAYAQQLEQQRQQLLVRWSQLEQRINQLDAQEVRLRAALSERYGREFPSLDE